MMCAVSWTMMWPKASVVNSTEMPLARCSVRFMFISSVFVSHVPLATRLILELRRIGAAGGRHDAVEPHVKHELAVVVGAVPDGDVGDAQSRVRSGVRAFDGIKHVFLRDGAEGFP